MTAEPTAAKSPRANAPRLAKEEWSDSKSVELERSRTNLNKLVRGRKNGEKPMKYEEWSKSNELDRTLTPKFVGELFWRNTGRDFEQKVTKATKGRK